MASPGPKNRAAGSETTGRTAEPNAVPTAWLAGSAVLAIVVLGSASYTLNRSGFGPATILVALEIGLLAYTLLILAWLSTLSIRAFSKDAATISATFVAETDRLLRENRGHWSDQSVALKDAITTLERAVELQASTLETTRLVMEFNKALLDLERERDRLRTESAELRRQRMQPLVGFVVRIPSGGVQLKHVNVVAYNRGSDAHDIAIFFGVPQVDMLEAHLGSLTYHGTHMFDFGDISRWPDSATFEITVEASDLELNRYRFTGTVNYSRNKAAVVSYPTVDPDDWQFPMPVRAN